VQAFAARYNIKPEHVIAGNGTTQFIYGIPQVLETKRALILGPTYADYADACRMHNVRYDYMMAEEPSDFKLDVDFELHVQNIQSSRFENRIFDSIRPNH